jgi:diguanylate cyclase (GGDEF)-like protein
MHIETREKQLQMEVAQLHREMERLQQTNQNLQIALSRAAERGSLVEARLIDASQQLQAEIEERKRMETSVGALMEFISKQAYNLERTWQMLQKHSNFLETSPEQSALHSASIAMFLDQLIQIASCSRFDQYLEQQWSRMADCRFSLSLVFCHLACLEQLYDTCECADHACLEQIVAVFDRSVKRSADLVAHRGGAVFAAILPKTALNGALIVAQQIQSGVAALSPSHTCSQAQPQNSQPPLHLSMSVVSTVPRVERSPRILVDEAEQLLYSAKRKGVHDIVHACLD